MTAAGPPSTGRLLGYAAVPAALLLSGAMVFQSSQAAFTASTSNGPESWSAGTVALTDDDATSVIVSATNLRPGSTVTKCINITYSGSLATQVRL